MQILFLFLKKKKIKRPTQIHGMVHRFIRSSLSASFFQNPLCFLWYQPADCRRRSLTLLSFEYLSLSLFCSLFRCQRCLCRLSSSALLSFIFLVLAILFFMPRNEKKRQEPALISLVWGTPSYVLGILVPE